MGLTLAEVGRRKDRDKSGSNGASLRYCASSGLEGNWEEWKAYVKGFGIQRAYEKGVETVLTSALK